MSGVGRLAVSAVSATNENDLALANFDVDFALIKVEAPKEYHGLGAVLSHRRLENAEQGPLHRTARRLGALFEHLVPPIQILVEAYGKRVSEISASGKLNRKGSQKDGPFANYVGIDGTSIYAAATSGTSAIAVHLLACLLARTWSGAEATELWSEVVSERKKDIEANSDSSRRRGMAERKAAQQEISRADLANWDASARAWLLSADEVKSFENTHLKLITTDCGLFASSLGSTYASVIDVWTTAMSSLQILISGVPQEISKGAILIGLSSWHIYPDLNLMSPIAHLKFNDSLVDPRGVITIGIKDRSFEPGTGVQWSLSLSHPQSYGNPVRVVTYTGTSSLRINMEQLQLVALGSVIGSWGYDAEDVHLIAEWFLALRDCLGDANDETLKHSVPWLCELWTAAELFLGASSKIRKEDALSLITYGRRKGQNFLGKPDRIASPLLGMDDPWQLATLSTDFDFDEVASEEEAITRLRLLAEERHLPRDCGIIRYRRKANWLRDVRSTAEWEFTTAIPTKYTEKRDSQGLRTLELVHTRWIESRASRSRVNVPRLADEECRYFDREELWLPSDQDYTVFETPRHRFSSTIIYKSRSQEDEVMGNSSPDADDEHSWNTRGIVFFRMFNWRSSDVRCLYLEKYDYVLGDAKNVALFVQMPNILKGEIYVDDAIDFLESGKVRSQRTLRYLETLETFRDGSRGNPEHQGTTTKRLDQYAESLLALSQAKKLYSHLPGATVSMSVVERPLCAAKWYCRGTIGPLRCNKFACIAMFESGTLDIEPSVLSGVMAISSGNSMYVANALLQDPLEPDPSTLPVWEGITRILGNLGRAGIVMLVPPEAPLVQAQDPTARRLVSHVPFTNKTKRYFAETSLHLSFTEHEAPLNVPFEPVDAQPMILKSLVSVYDRSTWIADIDILRNLLDRDKFRRLRRSVCKHTDAASGRRPPPTELAAIQMGKAVSKRLVAIGNWDELLDPPKRLGQTTIAVVRASGNWQARLALMSVSIQNHHRTVVLPGEALCTVCGSESIKDMAAFAEILIT